MSPRAGTPIRAVTCDFWYTLVYLNSTDRRILESERARVWYEEFRSAGFSSADSRQYLRFLARRIHTDERRGLSPTVEARVRWLARRTRRALDPGRVRAGLSRVVEGVTVRTAPGLSETLADLRRARLKLGIVSNVQHEPPESLEVVLRRLGLRPHFGSVVFSPQVGRAKPSPEPFRKCLRELDVEPQDAVHIGDLRSDVAGARRAGMRPVLFTGLRRWRPRALVPPPVNAFPGIPRMARWRDLPGLLRSIE